MNRISTVLFLLAAIVTTSIVAQQAHHIDKIYYHRSRSDCLELGQLVFYFTHEPSLERLPKSKHTSKEHEQIFCFAGVTLEPAAVKAVRDMKQDQSLPYRIDIKAADSRVKCCITYNPNKVAVAYESFTAIDMHKGLVFRFYNKEVHDALRKKGGVMLRTASAKKKPHIVIDCGHGGADQGAVSSTNVREKELTLMVGLATASLLKNAGFDVLLTRTIDKDVALDARTTLANRADADLFISIHANAAGKLATGIETFCLADGLFVLRGADDLVCRQIVQSSVRERCMQSKLFANCVHEHTIASAKKKQVAVVDRSVKHAAAQVLMGTAMPAVLIELGFLSSEQEAALLADPEYQLLLAQGICDGVMAYVKKSAVIALKTVLVTSCC